MSALGNGYREFLLNAILGTGHFASFPNAMFCALWTVTPNPDGTGGTEVANANGYARTSYTNNGTNWGAAAANLKTNATVLTFPEATGSWGTVAGMTFHTSGTYGAGSLILVAALTAPVAVGDENQPYFPIGGLDWSVAA